MRTVHVGSSSDDDRTPEQRAEDRRRLMMRINPPENEIPGSLALSRVLGRTDDLAVAMTGAFVYSAGISLRLAVRLRRPDPDSGRDLYEDLGGHARGRRGGGSSTALLLGIEYPDGRTASNLGDWRTADHSGPERPLLHAGGGGGGGSTYDMDFWLWPLPPPGDLTIVAAWPDRGLAESRTVIAAADLAAARAQVAELWPWESPAEPAVLPPPRPADLPDGWFKDTFGESPDPHQP